MSTRSRFWIVTLSALLVASLTFSLGLWQLDRAAQKLKLSADRQHAKPIQLIGHWLTEQTVYLDNRQMDGRQGFVVVTPLATSANDFVLVERGWIARDFLDRKRLQPIQTLSSEVTIEARVMQTPAAPAVFAADWGREYPIVQYVDAAQITARMKGLHDLGYKGIVQQIEKSGENLNDGIKRNWYEPASGVEKNYGYAFQWFALCALVVGLYFWFQWFKPKTTS